MIATPTFSIRIIPHDGIRRTAEALYSFGKIFPDNFNRLALDEMAKDIIRKAKQNASRGRTGYLASSIKKGKESFGTKRSWLQIIASARYAAAQEYGYKPHIIPLEYLEQHYSSPGIKGIDTQELGFKPRGYALVARSRPFLAPAIEYTLQNLDRYADRAFQKTLHDSKLK